MGQGVNQRDDSPQHAREQPATPDGDVLGIAGTSLAACIPRYTTTPRPPSHRGAVAGLPRHPSSAPGQPRPPGEEVLYAHPHPKSDRLIQSASPRRPLAAWPAGQLGLAGVAAFPVREVSMVASLRRRLAAQNAIVARCLWVCLSRSAATRSWTVVGVGVSVAGGTWRGRAAAAGGMGEGVDERGQASSCREGRSLGKHPWTACIVARAPQYWIVC